MIVNATVSYDTDTGALRFSAPDSNDARLLYWMMGVAQAQVLQGSVAAPPAPRKNGLVVPVSRMASHNGN